MRVHRIIIFIVLEMVHNTHKPMLEEPVQMGTSHITYHIFPSYCRHKTLMVGHGGSSAGSYLADPTSTIPSHCASGEWECPCLGY